MTVAQLNSLVTLLTSRPVPETPDVAQSRARYEKLASVMGGAPDARCEKVDAGGVPAEWVAAPGIDGQRAVLYLHGGGYAIGSINTHRRLAYDISAASSARVLVIDYRLAPEHPFPAAVDDAAKAWRWLLQQGLAPNRLAISASSSDVLCHHTSRLWPCSTWPSGRNQKSRIARIEAVSLMSTTACPSCRRPSALRLHPGWGAWSGPSVARPLASRPIVRDGAWRDWRVRVRR